MSFNRQFDADFITRNAVKILFSIIALGAFLRLYSLDYKSLWIDELYTIVPTNPSNTINFIINYAKSDQPPLFFIMIHYWFKLFAYSAFYARLMAAVIGIAGVVSMYFLGKEIKSKSVGLFAALLCCLNYFHIYYSQESRFYGLLFLLTAVSFTFFLRSLRLKTLGSYVGYVLSTIALLYTQYYGILIFLIQGLLFIVYAILYRPKRRFILTGIGLGALVSVAFSPWLPVLLYDNAISSYWIERPKIYFAAVYYYLYWGKDVLISVLLGVVALFYIRDVARRFKTREIAASEEFILILLVSWIFFSYAIPYIRSLFAAPVLIPRYTIVTLPALFLVMSLGLELLVSKRKLFLVFISLICLSALCNLFIFRNHYFRTSDKAQWREAANVVINNNKGFTTIYSNLEWWYNFYFYDTRPKLKVTGVYTPSDEPGIENFLNTIEGETGFWVLSGESTNNGVTSAQQKYLDSHYEVAESHIFYGSSAVLYKKK